MALRKIPRDYKVYLPLVLTLVFFVFMLPRSPRFGYEYKKGEYWMYETLVAEYDFPILKTSGELQAEKDSVKQVKVSAGAGFVVALTGDIMTMPGLPKHPAAENIDVDENGVISGLF